MLTTSPDRQPLVLPDGTAFVEGKYVAISDARLPVLDWGFLRSDATYDVVHVWHGTFFRLDDHLERFERSCAALRLQLRYGRGEIKEILTECVKRSGLRDAYVEMICTRGLPALGSRDPRTCENSFVAFAIPFVWIFSPQQQEDGGTLVISGVQRIPPESLNPHVKSFHWGDMTQALFEAYDRGADTAVLVDTDGNVSEGPGFNVFCVNDDAVLSPGATVLEGITRRTVRELCEELEIPFQVGKMTCQLLRDADEVFVTSTAGGIMPIIRVDDQVIGHGEPGRISRKLKDLYWRKHEEGWHGTPICYNDGSKLDARD